MYRIIGALVVASVLVGCEGSSLSDDDSPSGIGTGTQPLVPEADDPVDPDPADPGNPNNQFGTEFNEDLTVNEMTFDPATGELVLNGVPFDGDDNLYTRDATVSDAVRAASGTGYDVYRNVAGTSDFYAVFRRSASGFTQAGALATDRYVSFGFGGVGAQRLEGSGALPNSDQSYVFTGEYAAVRTVVDATSGNRVQYVAGTSVIDVDIEDFDDIGAVEGLIVDRTFFDANGVQITDLDNADYIALATGQINFDDWSIVSSDATVFQAGGAKASGNWQGLFAGPNGEEVAGIVVVEGSGPIGIDPDTGEYIEVSVRETGTFIATRP